MPPSRWYFSTDRSLRCVSSSSVSLTGMPYALRIICSCRPLSMGGLRPLGMSGVSSNSVARDESASPEIMEALSSACPESRPTKPDGAAVSRSKCHMSLGGSKISQDLTQPSMPYLSR